MDKKYDIIVVGSGLGGLVSAIILAKEGKKVCVLEKNNQYGGNLQTFVRDKTIFDTGVHYIGGLSPGQNLHKYFSYLGIMNQLRLKKMDPNGFDRVTFDDDPNEYPYAQGYDNFVEQLKHFFPEEEGAIQKYVEKIKETCDSFPLYNLNDFKDYDHEILTLNARDCINSLTQNEKLRAVLAGTNFLYVGIGDKTPFYVHALSTNSYIQSSWRCINGGSQITKLLIKQLKKYGGEIYKRQEVTGFELENQEITAVQTKKGDTFYADLFISNIEPKTTLKLIGKKHFRGSFYNRIQDLEVLPSVFTLYLVFKPNTFKYFNHNYYHTNKPENVWTLYKQAPENWPEGYMLSMNVSEENQEWAESMTIMTYMNFEEVKPWADTFNTVVSASDRGLSYEEFKKAKTEKLLDVLEKKFPDIRKCIKSTYMSTPLSYRDYIGCHNGNLYGYVKDSNNPLRTFISPKTKIKNLFLTGQNINMHGVLGVTIGAVVTCSEILGRNYLIRKINQELAENEVSSQ